MAFTTEQEEEIVSSLKSIAESLIKLADANLALAEAANKSPWDDPKTLALLKTASEGSGLIDSLAANGLDLEEDGDNGS